MNNDDNKVNTMFFGRQRRIEFVEKILYVVLGIAVIVLVIFLISKQMNKEEEPSGFTNMLNYMQDMGYYCEMIHTSGGSCTLKGTNSTSIFTRYDNGFQFTVKTNNYYLFIEHLSNNGDKITFDTYDTAYTGYKNRKFTCKMKSNILSELDSCTDTEGLKLDLAAYTGVIENAIHSVNLIIDSSGYDKDVLLSDYIWKES